MDEKKWYEQPSTWKGLTLLLGLIGYAITPEHIAAIASTAATLYSLMAIFWDRN